MSMRYETQLLTCSGDDSGGWSDDERKGSRAQWNMLVSTAKKNAAKSRTWWMRWLPWWMKDAKFRHDEARRNCASSFNWMKVVKTCAKGK